jgi:uncharacterized protein
MEEVDRELPEAERMPAEVPDGSPRADSTKLRTSFLADAMLGRLARWLRAIDADTVQLPLDATDHELVARAEADERVLLTRDRHLLRELRPVRAFAIESDVPLQQLTHVVRAFELPRPAEFLTRCLLDNSPLRDVPRSEANELVPPRSRDLPGAVRRCPSCDRVYWRGSHVRRMEAALLAALPEWG